MSEMDPRLRKQLEALREVPPRDPRRAAEGRARFLQMAAEMKPEKLPAQAVSSGLFWRLKKWIQPKPQLRKEGLKMVNILVAALMAISVIFGGGAAAAYASQDALPGDTLYPVKEVVEQAELMVTTNPQTKAELHLEFAQERVAEIQTLVEEGRTDMIPQVAQNLAEHLQAAEKIAEQMAQRGQADAAARVAVMTDVAAQMLQQAAAHADEHSKQALQEALQHTEEARMRAMEAYTEAEQHAAQAEKQGEEKAGEMQHQAGEAAQQGERQGEEATKQAEQHAGEAMGAGEHAAGEIFKLEGTVESIDGNTWVVNGQTLVVPDDAKVKGDVKVGDMVEVHGYIDPNGQATVVQAKVITQEAGQEEHQGEMKQVLTFQGAVEAQNENQWVVAGRTLNITEDTKIHGQIATGDQVMVVAEVESDGTLNAKAINFMTRQEQNTNRYEKHNGEPTMAPESTETSEPTETMEPTETSEPTETMEPTETPEPPFMWGMGNSTATPEGEHEHEGNH